MLAAKACEETSGMLGDGMAGSRGDVKRGMRSGKGNAVHGPGGSEEACPEGIRVPIGAEKRSNARGAKGDRRVEA